MASTNPNVSGLAQYVATNERELLYKAATGANTLRHIRIQPGIWGKGAINVATPTINFNGTPCGFNPTTATAITQRDIETSLLIVQQTFCDDMVRNTYLEELFNRNGHITDAEFFEKFWGATTAALGRRLDHDIWRGVNTFHGFVILINDQAFTPVNPNMPLNVITSTPQDVFNALQATIGLMTPEIILNGDGRLFVAEPIFSKLLIAINTILGYPIEVPSDAAEGIKFPGTNLLVVPTSGLNSTGETYAIGGDKNNFVFGTGFDTDRPEERFVVVYDEAEQVWKMTIKFTAGVNFVDPTAVYANVPIY